MRQRRLNRTDMTLFLQANYVSAGRLTANVTRDIGLEVVEVGAGGEHRAGLFLEDMAAHEDAGRGAGGDHGVAALEPHATLGVYADA